DLAECEHRLLDRHDRTRDRLDRASRRPVPGAALRVAVRQRLAEGLSLLRVLVMQLDHLVVRVTIAIDVLPRPSLVLDHREQVVAAEQPFEGRRCRSPCPELDAAATTAGTAVGTRGAVQTVPVRVGPAVAYRVDLPAHDDRPDAGERAVPEIEQGGPALCPGTVEIRPARLQRHLGLPAAVTNRVPPH